MKNCPFSYLYMILLLLIITIMSGAVSDLCNPLRKVNYILLQKERDFDRKNLTFTKLSLDLHTGLYQTMILDYKELTTETRN